MESHLTRDTRNDDCMCAGHTRGGHRAVRAWRPVQRHASGAAGRPQKCVRLGSEVWGRQKHIYTSNNMIWLVQPLAFNHGAATHGFLQSHIHDDLSVRSAWLGMFGPDMCLIVSFADFPRQQVAWTTADNASVFLLISRGKAWCIGAAAGLSHLHEAGIAHQNLNLWVCPSALLPCCALPIPLPRHKWQSCHHALYCQAGLEASAASETGAESAGDPSERVLITRVLRSVVPSC